MKKIKQLLIIVTFICGSQDVITSLSNELTTSQKVGVCLVPFIIPISMLVSDYTADCFGQESKEVTNKKIQQIEQELVSLQEFEKQLEALNPTKAINNPNDISNFIEKTCALGEEILSHKAVKAVSNYSFIFGKKTTKHKKLKYKHLDQASLLQEIRTKKDMPFKEDASVANELSTLIFDKEIMSVTTALRSTITQLESQKKNHEERQPVRLEPLKRLRAIYTDTSTDAAGILWGFTIYAIALPFILLSSKNKKPTMQE